MTNKYKVTIPSSAGTAEYRVYADSQGHALGAALQSYPGALDSDVIDRIEVTETSEPLRGKVN